MKNIIIGVITIITFTLTAGYVYANTVAVQNALAYLQSQEDSTMKSIAQSVAGESIDVSFLKASATDSAIKITKPIMAIVSAGEDPRTYPDVNLVEALKNYYDGVQMGDAAALNDDVWAIFALVSAGEKNSEEVIGMVQFLLNNQNSDGGFSWGVEVESDTDSTAVAVMALLASGVSPTNQAIADARAYVLSNQNDDGGFLSNPTWGTDSNSATGAWVLSMIHALGEDPSTWIKNGKSPIDHILTLQDNDGSFWWVTEGTSEWNNKGATPDVVIGLVGYSYPTHIMEYAGGVSVEYRFEGLLQQVCQGETLATAVIDVIEKASIECPFDHEYTVYDFGSMLTRINNDEGNWMYFVNDISAMVGASDYLLKESDSVLWYYAGTQWGWLPTRMILDNDSALSIGDTLYGTVEYYDEGSSVWKALEEATVKFNGTQYTTDGNGVFSFTVESGGVFEILAEKDGYVRTDISTIIVSDTSDVITLSVNVVQSGNVGGGNNPGESIGITVSPTTLSFGDIVPGKHNTQQVLINNVGTVALTVKAQVIGDSIFHFLKIADSAWNSFMTLLGVSEEQTHDIKLAVPTSYASYGDKQGSLIFWGTRAN